MTAEKKQTFDMLLSPMNIGKLTVKNRTVMTAAEMGMGDMDGKPTEKLMSYYEERAKGGVGLIITATTRVNDWYAASTFTQLAMSHDYHIAPMHEFAQRIHRHGAKLAVQLHHAGRQGYCTPINNLPFLLPMVHAIPKMRDLVFKMTGPLYAMEQRDLLMAVQAPSKGERSYHTPSKMRAMTTREVKRLIQDFINAAVRCQKAGVDAVELHAAHGYIIEQFLSPNTNKRTDEYGGSLENRMRMLLEIIAGIRERCGDYPIIVRLTVDEMYDRIGKPGKGYTLEEGKLMAKRLEEAGIDAINVTSACYDTYNYWLEPTSFEPGWRAYLAKEIKNTVSIPVIAANFMRSPAQAERQLEEGVQDFIGSARSFFVDPYWVQKVESGHPELVRRCIGCLYCMNSMTDAAFKGTNGQCALNPYLGREHLPAPKRDGGGRLAVVVGAGPAGLTAAETLARRGFAVRIFEKEEKAGGQVKTACLPLLFHRDGSREQNDTVSLCRNTYGLRQQKVYSRGRKELRHQKSYGRHGACGRRDGGKADNSGSARQRHSIRAFRPRREQPPRHHRGGHQQQISVLRLRRFSRDRRRLAYRRSQSRRRQDRLSQQEAFERRGLFQGPQKAAAHYCRTDDLGLGQRGLHGVGHNGQGEEL